MESPEKGNVVVKVDRVTEYIAPLKGRLVTLPWPNMQSTTDLKDAKVYLNAQLESVFVSDMHVAIELKTGERINVWYG
jgi:hypothetical protein